MSAGGRDFEALVAGACGLALLAATAAGVAVRIIRESHQVEPAPYSVCEYCGQVLDGTNNVCVPEGYAEGSSK